MCCIISPMDAKLDTKRTLDETQKELRDLLAQRAEIDRRIVGLGQVIKGLKTLGETPEIEDETITSPLAGLESGQGFTNAIRHIIRNSPNPITAMEIRDELEAGGYSGPTPKHTLISVYTVIGRLKDKEEIAEVMRSGKPAYATSPNHLIAEALGFRLGRKGKLSDMDLTDPNHPLVRSGMRPQKK
jgi:hypothetical protein